MSISLFTETAGRGPDLFLVHGWALHGGVWDGLVGELTRAWRVTRVDMPGHGYSRELPMPVTLRELAASVASAAPEQAVWLGWSLGGMAALRAALDCPARVRALALVGASPRFVTATDWPQAVAPEKLAEFTRDLERDYHGTVQRFLALQVRGDRHAGDTLRQMCATLFDRGEPRTRDLAAGLEVLRSADLRAEIPRIVQPALVMAGGYDRLTPPQAGAWLAGQIPGANFELFPRAAHAPFLSHRKEFMAALREFLDGLGDAPAVQPGGALRRG